MNTVLILNELFSLVSSSHRLAFISLGNIFISEAALAIGNVLFHILLLLLLLLLSQAFRPHGHLTQSTQTTEPAMVTVCKFPRISLTEPE